MVKRQNGSAYLEYALPFISIPWAKQPLVNCMRLGLFILSYSISAMPQPMSRMSKPTSLYDSYYFPCKTLSTLPDFLSISI